MGGNGVNQSLVVDYPALTDQIIHQVDNIDYRIQNIMNTTSTVES